MNFFPNISIAFASTEFQIAILGSLGARNTQNYFRWTRCEWSQWSLRCSMLMKQKKGHRVSTLTKCAKVDRFDFIRRATSKLLFTRNRKKTCLHWIVGLHHQIRNENDQKLKPIEKVELIIMLLWIHRTIGNHHIDAVYLHLGCTRTPYAKWVLCGLHAMHDAMCSRAQVNGQCEHCMRTANEWHVNPFHLNCSLDHLIRSL